MSDVPGVGAVNNGWERRFRGDVVDRGVASQESCAYRILYESRTNFFLALRRFLQEWTFFPTWWYAFFPSWTKVMRQRYEVFLAMDI
jgi:hypothetical protein